MRLFLCLNKHLADLSIFFANLAFVAFLLTLVQQELPSSYLIIPLLYDSNLLHIRSKRGAIFLHLPLDSSYTSSTQAIVVAYHFADFERSSLHSEKFLLLQRD